MVFHRNPSFPTQGNIFELKLNTTDPELEVKDLHHSAGLLAPLLKSQQQLSTIGFRQGDCSEALRQAQHQIYGAALCPVDDTTWQSGPEPASL